MEQLIEILKPELNNLIDETKISLKEVRRVAIAEAWKILQLAVANTIRAIEDKLVNVPGKDKKAVAMEFLSMFYDSVFTIVDIPFIPPIIESFTHKYVKIFLMILISSTIDAMVTTFREVGVFNTRSS